MNSFSKTKMTKTKPAFKGMTMTSLPNSLTRSALMLGALIASFSSYAAELQLETQALSNVSSSAWTTVSFSNSYVEPVVVCSIRYNNNALPQLVRMRNAQASSVEVQLQNPSNLSLSGEAVDCLIVEAGTWTLPDGRAIEAQRVVSSTTNRKNSWTPQGQSYNQSYTNPVVLGQVMTNNDADWSVFWASNGSQTNPASSTGLATGKHVGEDSDTTRANETLGFIVIEAGSGAINGVAYEVALGADSVRGYNTTGYTYSFNTPFSQAPSFGVVTQSAMDGGDGSWASLVGVNPFSSTGFTLLVDEDQIGDGERNHTNEQVSYIVFAESVLIAGTGNTVPVVNAVADQTNTEGDSVSLAITASDTDGDILTFSASGLPTGLSIDPATGIISGIPTVPGSFAVTITVDDNNGGSDNASFNWNVNASTPATGLLLETQAISGVSSGAWTTVSFSNSYVEPVVVCSIRYNNNTVPQLVRMRNAQAASVEIQLQNPSNLSLSGEAVDCLIVEAGTWTLPDGRAIEAQRVVSTITNRKNSWTPQGQNTSQSYTNPVVLGQVMTTNDADWSVFWASNGSQTNPASATGLATGKHVGEDSDTTRANETLGFIVIEAGSGAINGVAYEAALGADNIGGYNTTGYNYTFNTPFSQAPSFGVVTQSAMDGGDGSWASLLGASPFTSAGFTLLLDEDRIGDGERNHTNEQVSYFVFAESVLIGGTSNTAPIITAISDQTNTEDDSVNLTITASDADGDLLAFSASGLPTGLSIDSATGIISGIPTVPGSFAVTVTVDDSNGGSDNTSFNWNVDVLVVNTPPVIATIADQSNIENDSINLAVIANDADGDTLIYSATDLPTGLTIDSGTGIISGNPSVSGSFVVTVNVDDGNGGADSTNFTWTIEALVTNTPPVITAIVDQINTEGDSVNLLAIANDADGDSLSFSAIGLPAGLNINSVTGQISGFTGQSGSFAVTVSVDDGNGGSDSTSFNWTVNALPAPPPVDTNPVSRSSSFTYNVNGQVLTIDGPRTDVNDITTFEYDAQGNRSKTINALGQETLFTSYDASGRLLSMTDPNGVITNLTYDPRGRLVSRTVAGVTTAFDYDGVGQLIKITLPNNAELNYSYDGARRLTDIEDNLGNRISYTLDNMGNRTGEAIFDDTTTLRRTQTRVFDELSRLIQSISADARSTTFAYDPNGNQTNSTDALSRNTQSSFDALDRLISTLDADNQTTQYGYDAQDNLTSVTDARGLTTSYNYDGFNNLQQLNSPDTGITDYTYDAAGNRITQTDARGITTRFIYDALNRLTEVRYPNAQFNINYTYDQGTNGIGRLTTLEDNSGTTTYQYDARGNLTQQAHSRNGVTHTTAYIYDNADNLTQITYPSGRIITMNRDALGRIAQVSANSQLLADNVSYLPFGPMTSLTYGNGLNATNSYDQDYRLTSQTVGNIFAQTYGYDLVDNITTITDSLTPANDQLFSYDPLDRLETAQGNYGNLAYSYDPVGNRTTETNPTGTNTYSYDTNSQQLDSITGNTNSTLSYDANGNLITQDSTTYSYSDLNRLAQATNNGQTTDYLYNGRGERTVKQGQTSTTLYHYDQSGLLLAETDEQGNSIRDYVYLNGQRLAILDNTGTYYIHSNHLDTPQVITDQNQTVVWQATYTPFGEANITTASIENNLRFPGQYFDQETNLHYNYFRDYDPSIGRYITSDPIGLAGGLNTYAYALQNPVFYTDPTGEAVPAVIAACAANPACANGVRAAIGGVIGGFSAAVSALSDPCFDGDLTSIVLTGVIAGAASSFVPGVGGGGVTRAAVNGGAAGIAGNTAGQLAAGDSCCQEDGFDFSQAAASGAIGALSLGAGNVFGLRSAISAVRSGGASSTQALIRGASEGGAVAVGITAVGDLTMAGANAASSSNCACQ